MRIGLIDVDGHGKKKKWGATIYPNIALCKIARYHKTIGDNVEWAKPKREIVQTNLFYHVDAPTKNEYHRIYASKIFTFSPDFNPSRYDTHEFVFGGTGYDIKSLLPKEIDNMQPDYSIYPNIPKDYAYGFLTRGCPNKCKWCVVPQKEGAVRPYMDVDEIAIEGRNKLVLMDNNFLAAGDYAHDQLDKIIERGYRVDFNQALDARLVTDDFARKLAKVKWLDKNRIRFGCDTQAQIKECERAIDMIISYGFHGEFFLYTMLNDNFQECYNRIHYWWERLQNARNQHIGNCIYAYAQPYRDPYNPNQQIPKWQKDMANWVNKKAHFVAHSFEEFEPRKGFKCIQYFK